MRLRRINTADEGAASAERRRGLLPYVNNVISGNASNLKPQGLNTRYRVADGARVDHPMCRPHSSFVLALNGRTLLSHEGEMWRLTELDSGECGKLPIVRRGTSRSCMTTVAPYVLTSVLPLSRRCRLLVLRSH